ncbi:uncharacterized protein isoform X2 [Rhodnius prolixus]|uniref:uncharacterized protein isoform X2 n=1 Tax=Rhodnius prolixus TaxID=13249 RepID=UPI003D18FAB3
MMKKLVHSFYCINCLGLFRTGKALSSGNPIKLVDSLKTYEKLITICEEVNDVYGFPIIFVFVYSFAFSITECYSALSKTAPNALMYVTWSTLTWSTAFRLVFTCSQVMYQAKEFNKKLKVSTADFRYLERSVQLKVLIHFARRQKLVFTASKFFNLDFPFLGKILMQAAIYFLLLIQLNGLIPLF